MDNQNNYPQQQQVPQSPAPQSGKGGTILCIISLILMFGGYSMGMFFSEFFDAINDHTLESVGSIATALMGGSSIAAWVLAIIARVKYKNTFSKVLIIIYIVLTVLSIIAFFLILAACVSITRNCPG